jgi:mono/diheme cytochrome c family protein
VFSGNIATRAGRKLARVLLLLPVLMLLSGCDPDPYPADLTYPGRKDLLVLKADRSNIPQTFGPGQLNHFIDEIRVKAEEDSAKFAFLDPAGADFDTRKTIANELEDRFGTPSSPIVKATSDPAFVKDLKLDPATLERGSLLYRRHCLHCHGVAGDGRGPTALWVNPPPRDYRQGSFKYTSTLDAQARKPLRTDLLRTLQEGVEGTSMPTFKTLPLRDLDALVSYVIHLSIRGQVELQALIRSLAEDKDVAKTLDSLPKYKPDLGRTLVQTIADKADQTASEWQTFANPIGVEASKLEEKLHPYPAELKDPAEHKQSIERGYKLFIGDGICISCHTDFGRQAQFRYDDWGTLVRPRNLTEGVYRGGRRPVDLYYRIHSGIGPSQMPGATDTIRKNPKAMWDLVNFVQALPYPGMLPDSVRQKVYGERK